MEGIMWKQVLKEHLQITSKKSMLWNVHFEIPWNFIGQIAKYCGYICG